MLKFGVAISCLGILFSSVLLAEDTPSRCQKWVSLLQEAPYLILHRKENMEERGRRPFFVGTRPREPRKPDVKGLKRFILLHPPLLLDPHAQKLLVKVLEKYQRGEGTALEWLEFKNASRFFGTSRPNLNDVLDFLKAQVLGISPTSQTAVQEDLYQAENWVLRAPYQFGLRHKWIILGATVFSLWTPFHAEIEAFMFGLFNKTRSVVQTPRSDTITRTRELDQLSNQLKVMLRDMYLISAEDYPTTMMMSRNNLSYLWDMVSKRSDEAYAAAERGDQEAIDRILKFLYAMPFLYQDILREPLGGFVTEQLLFMYETYDPERRTWESFKADFKDYSAGELPDVWGYLSRNP
jgi:hypothetical protein